MYQPSLAQIIKDRKSLFSTSGIIYKDKHQNSIYTIRSRGAFKVRGLSLKRQIIAKDTRTTNNQIPLRLRCWMPTSAFSELVREHRMETSLLVSYWFPMTALLEHDGKRQAAGFITAATEAIRMAPGATPAAPPFSPAHPPQRDCRILLLQCPWASCPHRQGRSQQVSY